MVTEQAIESARILLIDDDPEFIESTQPLLDGIGDVRIARDTTEALSVNVLWRPDLIIINVLAGHGGDSFHLLDRIRSERDAAPYGIICLAKGPGAITHFQHDGNELFGVMNRETDYDVLRAEISRALRLTTGRRDSNAA